jgi:hypothetical protein
MLGVALQLWPAAGPGRLPESLDLMLQYVPNAAYMQRRLAGGGFPLWNPYLGTGMPFAADPGAGAWYVPSWPLLLTLPLDAAVRAHLWLHLGWAAAGVYGLCRGALRVGAAASLVGAASFALTSWLPALAGMPAVLTSVAWCPWILLLGLRVADRDGSTGAGAGRHAAALAAAGGLQVVSGWPAGAYLAWLSLGIVLLARGTAPRRLVGVGGAGLVALALAGVLIIPALEFIGESSYAETRSVEAAGREGYLTLLSWLRPAGGSGSLESSQLYAGIAALVLAAAGAIDRRPTARALVALALTSVAVGAGTRTPLFGALYAWLPGFRIVYLPARLGIPASLAVACLAALGLQALRERRVTVRRAVVALALVAALVPLTLLQFWQSEGYDSFRRLLTNLGRLAGGPYVARSDELRYVAVGLAAAALVAVAVRLRPSWAPAALCALVLIDGLAAQRSAQSPSFRPVEWYAAAVERAASLDVEGERVAGAQWHGAQHFLTDFPRSAMPSLLPPNLSLLAGVRDAQGYNPLLLRRAAQFFARANARVRGDARPDDHWLLVEDFHSPLLDQLGVARVLSPEDSAWRVRGVRVVGPATLRAGSPPLRVALASQVPSGGARVHVVSYLGEATALRTGEAVGDLALLGAAGEQRFTLRAGEHTAEWAYGRPDVASTVAHRQALVALETQLVDAVAGRFRVYEYRATFDVTLDSPLSELAVTSTLPASGQATLNLAGIWLEDPSVLPSAGGDVLRVGRARPRTSATSGTVAVLGDLPEMLALRVSAPGPTRVTVADAYYPGWIAAIDGSAAAIVESDGLFRAIDVPAGEHAVVIRYAPRALALGAGSTAAGAATLVGLLGWSRLSTISSRWRRKTSRP